MIITDPNEKTQGVKPSVGRIVHYWPSNGGAPMAAIITAVHPDEPTLVDLNIFYPHREPEDHMPEDGWWEFDRFGKPTSWSWPART